MSGGLHYTLFGLALGFALSLRSVYLEWWFWIKKIYQKKTKKNFHREKDGYWYEENGKKEGPFCDNCFDTVGNLSRMIDCNSFSQCRCCKYKYWYPDNN